MGALMLSIGCHHPDLEEFIGIKSDLDRVTKANISVRITDDFMIAVKNHEEFTLSFTREETGETIEKTVDAYEMFKEFSEMNWDYAEPGMLFWDRISSYNLVSEDTEFSYAGTNPCAEEPLPAGGSCLLGSINLAAFVHNKKFDYNDFTNTVRIATRALNDVLIEGLPLHPLQEQMESVRDWRQIGLGIMGLADMLIKMEIRYGSTEAIEVCDRIGQAMANATIDESSKLAYEKEAYPKYKRCVMDSEFFKNNTSSETRENVKKYGLYNSQLLTIAPTGSLSTMIGVSGGIEPIYANYYERKTESLHGHDQYYKVYTPIVQQYMDEHELEDDSELPDFFVTAQTIDYKERIEMQGIWQDHIDASISSTVNVPNNFTVEDVEDLYGNLVLRFVNHYNDIIIVNNARSYSTELVKKLKGVNEDDAEKKLDSVSKVMLRKLDKHKDNELFLIILEYLLDEEGKKAWEGNSYEYYCAINGLSMDCSSYMYDKGIYSDANRAKEELAKVNII